jgi:Ca-activated chloride channel family protein
MNAMPPRKARGRRCLALSIVLLSATMVVAQSLIDEVHITPRIAEKQTMLAGLTLPESSTKMIKVSVDLVLVPVTIVDDMNRRVKGLQSDNFDLFEGKHQQHIRYFSAEDVPISLGIVLDVSGSMKSKIQRAQEAVHEFLKSANPEDEFFMVTFSDTPQMISGFTQRTEDIENQLLYARPNGRTALLDALQLAMSKMAHARYQRKALLVISDGGDNHSRYTEGEVRSAFKEADVAMYSIGIFDRNFATSEEMLGPELLRELSDLTGGREFTIDNPNDLLPVAKIIGTELRNQYLLGYQPTMAPRDGKWHKIRIKFRRPKKVKLPPVHVYARTGYYARAD